MQQARCLPLPGFTDPVIEEKKADFGTLTDLRAARPSYLYSDHFRLTLKGRPIALILTHPLPSSNRGEIEAEEEEKEERRGEKQTGRVRKTFPHLNGQLNCRVDVTRALMSIPLIWAKRANKDNVVLLRRLSLSCQFYSYFWTIHFQISMIFNDL